MSQPWKLATRYRVRDRLNLRGSVGTGFRAPTPGQTSTTNVSTRVDPNGLPMAEGVYPATHPVSALFGALPLEAEDSTSWNLGLVAEPLDNLSLTLDYYHIRLDDRIVLSSQFAVTPDLVSQLGALGGRRRYHCPGALFYQRRGFQDPRYRPVDRI